MKHFHFILHFDEEKGREGGVASETKQIVRERVVERFIGSLAAMSQIKDFSADIQLLNSPRLSRLLVFVGWFVANTSQTILSVFVVDGRYSGEIVHARRIATYPACKIDLNIPVALQVVTLVRITQLPAREKSSLVGYKRTPCFTPPLSCILPLFLRCKLVRVRRCKIDNGVVANRMPRYEWHFSNEFFFVFIATILCIALLCLFRCAYSA